MPKSKNFLPHPKTLKTLAWNLAPPLPPSLQSTVQLPTSPHPHPRPRKTQHLLPNNNNHGHHNRVLPQISVFLLPCKTNHPPSWGMEGCPREGCLLQARMAPLLDILQVVVHRTVLPCLSLLLPLAVVMVVAVVRMDNPYPHSQACRMEVPLLSRTRTKPHPNRWVRPPTFLPRRARSLGTRMVAGQMTVVLCNKRVVVVVVMMV